MSVVKQRVLVVGLGTMGTSHARAYQAIDGFELVGLCTRNAAGRQDLDREFAEVPRFDDLDQALAASEARRGRDRRLYRTPRADGPQGARGRRARFLREAARRHARGG